MLVKNLLKLKRFISNSLLSCSADVNVSRQNLYFFSSILAKKGLKFVFILFLSSSILFFTFGCSKKTPGGAKPVEVKVAFWGAPEDIDIIKSVVSKWQVNHPGIKVRLEHTPYPGYLSKILTRIAGGAPPDILCAETNLFVSFFYKDILLDMSPFIQADPDFTLDDFFPEVIDRFSVDEKVYGIPRDTAPFACVYYNKKLFDEAGISYPSDNWDWYEFLDKAQRLTKIEDGRVIQYGFYGWAWENFVYSNGGGIVDDVKSPKRCFLNTQKTIAGIKFYVDLIHKYKVAPAPLDLGNLGLGAQQLFMVKKLAMFSSGIWETPILRRIKDFDWDVAMFPKGPGAVRGFGTGGSAYSILKTTEHPKECWEVIKCLAGREAQVMLAEAGLAQPAIKDIANGEHWAESSKKPLNKKMLNEAVQYVTYDPFHPRWREIRDLLIGQEFDLVFNGSESVEDAVNKIAPKIDDMLKKTQ